MTSQPKRRWQFSLGAFVLACAVAGALGGVAGPHVAAHFKARQQEREEAVRREVKLEKFRASFERAAKLMEGVEVEEVFIGFPPSYAPAWKERSP